MPFATTLKREEGRVIVQLQENRSCHLGVSEHDNTLPRLS
jgi:hypothetical protein